MRMEPWFKADSVRYEREIKSLRELDIAIEIDEALKAQKILRLKLTIEGGNPRFELIDPGSKLELIAVYPDLFPYFRPIVFAYGITLPRHFNPVLGNLCLLPRPTEFWEPRTTLAEHLHKQLNEVLRKGPITDPVELSKDPDEQAEPESEYYPDEPAPVIFDPSVFQNELEAKVKFLGTIRVGVPEGVWLPSRLAVLQTFDTGNKLLSELPSAMGSIFPRRVSGVLYQLPQRPPYRNANEVFKWLSEQLQEQGKKIPFRTDLLLKNGFTLKNVIGLNFPEEVRPGVNALTGWLFLVVYDRKWTRLNAKKQPYAVTEKGAYFAKASRVSKDDIYIRIPKLRPLADKSVVVVGLGALGAPSALEMARSGIGELRLLDYDLVEAATTIRWPLGITAAGLPKTIVLKSFIEQNYPATQVKIGHVRIGDVKVDGKSSPDPNIPFEGELLDELFQSVSLIYDASAEVGVMHFLSEEARRRGIPYVCVYATEGALGGVVTRIVPGKTEGCWMCLQWHRYEEQLPEPPADPSGQIQAIGCGDLSFTGAGFDLQNISLAGVRTVVSTLCEGEQGAYPVLQYDTAVLSLVDANGRPVFPSWSEHPLKRHPKCPYCGGV